MKRQRLFLLLTLLMSMVGTKGFAHDIEVANSDGINIYYNWYNNQTELQVTYQGTSYLAYSDEYSGYIVIPASVTYNNKNYSVTSISDRAFSDCSGLTGISIPASVKKIGHSILAYCPSLTKIQVAANNYYNGSSTYILEKNTWVLKAGCKNTVIPNSTMYIGQGAFEGCSGLTSVNIPNAVKSIGSSAFAGCTGLTSVTINSNLTTIGNSAFWNCSQLTNITIPSSVTSIGSSAFAGCTGLTSVNIPKSVTSIGEGVFQGCSDLTSISVASANTKYDSRDNCNAIIETASNTLIAGCKETVIPNSVTIIGNSAFSDCTYLTSIDIPNSVTSIRQAAFSGCSGLTSMIVRRETPPIIGNNIFSGSNYQNATLYVPAGCIEAYSSATYWQAFGEIKEITESITMATSSGSPRTMKGFSSANGLDFTKVSDVKAYIAVGFTASKDVLLARVSIVPPNTGVVLLTKTPGITVDVPVTLEDVYYANLLQPAVADVTIQPTETIGDVDYTNLMVGADSQTGEMGFITFSEAVTRSNNCYLQVSTSFYEIATASRRGLGIVFVDSESTGIQELMQNGTTSEAIYDLQGRKVTYAKKGLYIHNGKKFYVK